MAVDVIMPQMGESIFEGTITKWLKKPGDRIERDEPLFEISTDKVDAEIPAPSAGVLKEIKVTEGQTVPIQTVVAVIEAAGAAASAPAATHCLLPPAARKGGCAQGRAPPAPAAAAPVASAASGCSRQCARQRRRRFAALHWSGDSRRSTTSILTEIEGSGAGGRVSKKDILAALEVEKRKARGPCPPRAAPSAFHQAAGASGNRRRGVSPRAGKRRSARADLFRQLRSPDR